MKPLMLLVGLLFFPMQVNSFENYSQKITVMQINAKWNKHHNVDLDGLKNCKVQFAWLEDQPESLKNMIQTVPIIVIYDGKKPVRQWSADLSFQLDIDLDEIQKTINSIK